MYQSVEEKPTQPASKVGELSNKAKLKLKIKINFLAMENKLPAEYSKFEGTIAQGAAALKDVMNIFEKEGLQAVEAWLENCK